MLGAFLEAAFNDGRVRVENHSPAVDDAAREKLTQYEVLRRQEWAGDPPEFDMQAAAWAAILLFQSCRLIVFREVSAQNVRNILRTRSPADDQSAAVHYSVDLLFQHLPAVWKIARRISKADELVSALQDLATDWPLSSVGMEIPGVRTWHPAFDNSRSLRLAYVDRILDYGDESRLVDPQVRRAISSVVAARHELAPRMMAALKRVEKDRQITSEAEAKQ